MSTMTLTERVEGAKSRVMSSARLVKGVDQTWAWLGAACCLLLWAQTGRYEQSSELVHVSGKIPSLVFVNGHPVVSGSVSRRENSTESFFESSSAPAEVTIHPSNSEIPHATYVFDVSNTSDECIDTSKLAENGEQFTKIQTPTSRNASYDLTGLSFILLIVSIIIRYGPSKNVSSSEEESKTTTKPYRCTHNSHQQSSQPQKLSQSDKPSKSVTASEKVVTVSKISKRPPPPVDSDVRAMLDDEIVELCARGSLPAYSLEKVLQDPQRAVCVRRKLISQNPAARTTTVSLDNSALPYENFDFEKVMGTCCENVIGYMPLPLGVAGPLNIDGLQRFIPMATTEGALVASTNRGCTAINASGGVATGLMADGMTRGPSVRFRNLQQATEAKAWLDSECGFHTVEAAFNSTSRFAKLRSVRSVVVGSDMFIRFKSTTGDAMGMNMISKGSERALEAISNSGFPDMQIVSLSSNYCTDKKAAAINWVDGRGKSVSAQATIPAEVVQRVLKTDVDTLVELNNSKNLVGSAIAGAMGGFNAHAANIVAAIFIATGQDPAQVIESSSCLTLLKKVEDGALQISVYMPSIEVGTVGGGTVLGPQQAILDLLGVRGANQQEPGQNAQQLARIVAAGVLAGELSLCSALAAGSLVRSHMALNRK